MSIRHLPDHLINQIAAGEVVERPAAVVKELVENSIDAGASAIQIDLINGGKSSIVIADNGKGMSKDDLSKALERHATSKLPNDDLVNIDFLGFRGEALPSIASVSRLHIKTYDQDDQSAWQIQVINGNKQSVSPASHHEGTTITVSDLFSTTPARLKFLKSDRAEYGAIKDIITRMALCNPHISFKLTHNNEIKLSYSGQQGDFFDQYKGRIHDILGKEFIENSFLFENKKEGIHLYGYASLPSLNRATSQYQYMFVNGRAVKDKLLYGVIRAAYMDVLHSGRHPTVTLYLNLPNEDVDVNVHPGKAEVRFRDAAYIRGLIISTLKQALMNESQKTSSTLSSQTLQKLNHANYNPLPLSRGGSRAVPKSYAYNNHNLAEKAQEFYQPLEQSQNQILPSARYEEIPQEDQNVDFPLGAARAQIHENYIIAQSEDGLVIVDQHAAHERLVYEKLKKQIDENNIITQALLVPEIVDLDDTEIDLLNVHKSTFEKYGIGFDEFGSGSIAIQSLPSLLGEKLNVQSLIKDIIDEIKEFGTAEKIEKTIHEKLSSIACYRSIRSGRRMNADEMNMLLRDMEKTQKSGHCNHGRPTYIKFDLKDIERLFGRR